MKTARTLVSEVGGQSTRFLLGFAVALPLAAVVCGDVFGAALTPAPESRVIWSALWIAHPQVAVRLQREVGGRNKARVSLPQGVTGVFVWDGTERPLVTGTQTRAVPGRGGRGAR